ncbi:hypothetical protein [Leifsonia poae]|uniref:hypothetical protein n=1 Tax=Leifsonia poae TaxID=110933 RepID=UPI003D67EEFE
MDDTGCAQLTHYLRLLQRDFAAEFGAADFTVWNLRTREAVFGEARRDVRLSGFGWSGYAMEWLGTVTDVGHGSPATVAVGVAAALQDCVADRRGDRWPEVTVHGIIRGWRPRVGDDGEPGWSRTGERCRFGVLSSTSNQSVLVRPL